MSSVSGVLDKAAEIVQRGWCQGNLAVAADGRQAAALSRPDMSRPAVAHCTVGAVYAACDLLTGRDDALLRAAFHALDVQIGVEETADWNDAPERTQSEVVSALRAAAASARKAGA
jgi:hypothetical protein